MINPKEFLENLNQLSREKLVFGVFKFYESVFNEFSYGHEYDSPLRIVDNTKITLLNRINLFLFNKEKENEPIYEYELFFKSDDSDGTKMDGWYPIATERIKHPENIEKYIESGILRKIEQK